MDIPIKTTQVVDIGELRRCIYKFPNNKTKYIRFKNEFRKLTSVLREYFLYKKKSKKGGGEGDNTCLISHQIPEKKWKIVLSKQTYDILCLAKWFKTNAVLPHTQKPLTPDEKKEIINKIMQWDITIKNEFIQTLDETNFELSNSNKKITIFSEYAISLSKLYSLSQIQKEPCITLEPNLIILKGHVIKSNLMFKMGDTVKFIKLDKEIIYNLNNEMNDIYWNVTIIVFNIKGETKAEYYSCLNIIGKPWILPILNCFKTLEERLTFFRDRFRRPDATYSSNLETGIQTNRPSYPS